MGYKISKFEVEVTNKVVTKLCRQYGVAELERYTIEINDTVVKVEGSVDSTHKTTFNYILPTNQFTR